MKNVPGVMQFESKRFSVGRISPFSRAFFICASAVRADLQMEKFLKMDFFCFFLPWGSEFELKKLKIHQFSIF